MVGSSRLTTFASSSFLRLFCYIFFRWIPGHPLPPLITALAVIYSTGFFYNLVRTSPYKVVSNGVNVITTGVEDKHAQNGQSRKSSADPGEELDVEETLVVEQEGNHPVLTILTGLPNPTSRLWSCVTFSINMILVLGMLDLTYRSAIFYPAHDLSFTRLGYVSDTYAKILIREPDHKQLPIHLSYRYADRPVPNAAHQAYEGAWKQAEAVQELTQQTDFTALRVIGPLKPDTRYQYFFSNNNTGYLITAPRPGEFSQRGMDPSQAAAATSGSFSFLHSSCIMPRFPYNPLDHPLHIPGLAYLPKMLALIRPSFFLSLGDFIYIDVPRRHGDDAETYRREYRQVYASPDWASAATVPQEMQGNAYESYDLPWLHVYDDHEIANDWSANTSGVYAAAFDPYNLYHISGNPPSRTASNVRAATQSTDPTDETYTTFVHGPASFFIADTRRHRSAPGAWKSTMLGEKQLEYLIDWLKTPPVRGIRWKIFVTSVPFTRNWRVNSADTWGGYREERKHILEAMWAVNADTSANGQDGVGVVILSGDRHEHATTAFLPHKEDDRWGPGGAGLASVVEFSTSPASMFYLPFQSYREEEREGRPFRLPKVELPKGLTPSEIRQGKKLAAERSGYDPRVFLTEQDKCIYYHPTGNSKYGAVTIEGTTGSGQSILRYRLFVDGEEVWSHVLVAPERSSGGKGWGLSKVKENTWT